MDSLKKGSLYFIAVFLAIMLLSFSAAAYDTSLEELHSMIPSEILQSLPSSVFEGGEVTAQKLDVGFFFGFVLSCADAVLKGIFGDFALLLGIIVISCALKMSADSLSNEMLSSVCEYLSLLSIALAVWQSVSSAWRSCEELISSVTVFTSSMLPVMSALYTAGGNITTGAVRYAGMSALLTFLENFCALCLYPALRICFCFAIVNAVSNAVDLSPVITTVKNTVSFLLVFVMTLLSSVLAFQSSLTQSADSLLARTVKFAIGSFVPVVGGAVSEAMRTVTGSLGVIKSSVGVISVAVIILMLLPPLLELIVCRISLSFLSAASKMLGSAKVGTFLSDIKGIFDVALALSASAGVFGIFCFTLLIRTACAV